MSRRRVVYVTGTRADFGLAESMLRRIHAHPSLDLTLIVTGMHRVRAFGHTERLVEASGLPIGARVDMLLAGDSRAAMAQGIGLAIIGMTQSLERLAPEVVLVLGDRGEMLAAAIAGLHLGIAVAHCHGGDVSGTIDEAVRHAISKLAHLHFAATSTSAERLRRLGERAEHVYVTGAPGLDATLGVPIPDRAGLCETYGLDPSRPWALLIYHPSPLGGDAGIELEEILAGLEDYEGQLVAVAPNSDAGRQPIVERLEKLVSRPDVVLLRNVPRDQYLGFLAHAQLMVGNSSSGIIEAPSFGIPVLNVGSRQDRRERGDNVLDVPARRRTVAAAVERACSDAAFRAAVAARRNPYGDGHAGERIAKILTEVELGPKLLDKRLAY